MENLETKIHAILPNRLQENLSHVIITTFPTPSLFALYHGDYEAQFCAYPLNLSDDPKSQTIPTTSKPVALTFHNEFPLLACRNGALLSLQPEGPEHLGDFTDDDPSRSGILAAASSPDGCLLLVVSPVSVSILDADLEINAELPCEGVAQDARVAWRSDGDFFVVLRTVGGKTTGFVADRACKVVKKLELEDSQRDCCVDWEPRPGGMIAVSHGRAVLFFERNGLRQRRSDFDIGRKVCMVRWSGDAGALLIFGERVVEIWMKRNYMWYCKKRLVLPDFVDGVWDEDDPRLVRLFLSNGEVRLVRFNTVPSTCLSVDHGPLLAVTHGKSVILTNLGEGVVPPPMNHGILKFDAGIDAACCLDECSLLGFLLTDGCFETAVLNEALGKAGVSLDCLKENSLASTRKRWRLSNLDDAPTNCDVVYRAPVLITKELVAVVRQEGVWLDQEMPMDEVNVFRIQDGESVGELVGKYTTEGQITSVCASKDDTASLTITVSSRNVVRVLVDVESGACVETSRVSCDVAGSAASVLDVGVKGSSVLTVVLSEEGRLEIVDMILERSRFASDECTSFTVLSEFLVFTTRSNLLYCVPLRMEEVVSGEQKDSCVVPLPRVGDSAAFSDKGGVRPIDRGSVIVGGLQDEVSVVLQAPRGNLETIAPRPAVLRKITTLVASENYGSAFALCRRQRIDMNHIVDQDFSLFLKNVDTFVSQIGVAEHLSVFMTLLKGDTDKVNAVCEAVVKALQRRSDKDRFTPAILTGMMKQEPGDFEGALQEIKRASASSKENGRIAVDYLFVLMKNQELIYGHALGTYDLDLASFIAESSQMDPADYHSELTSLRKKDERERKTSIDMKLKRYDKALVHLHGGGKEQFQNCVSLCLEHSLYDTGLKLFREEEDIIKVLLQGYGGKLKDESRFEEAAAVFQQIDDSRNASECYRLGGRWQLAAHCAGSKSVPEDEKVALWNSIATDLEESGRIVESAQMRANFLGEFGTALRTLVDGEEWEAAFEIGARAQCSQDDEDENKEDYLEGLAGDVVQSARTFISNTEENRTKLHDRNQRLATIRKTKQAMREQLSRRENEADSEVFSETASSLSNLSDITFYSKTSATSLYSTTQTGVLSSAKLEKKALRRKQRESKKRIREGHPREEEAIGVYMRKLLPTEFALSRAEKFVLALLFCNRRDVAGMVVREFRRFVKVCLELPDDVLERKGWLEGIIQTWVGGLPSAFVGLDDDDKDVPGGR